MSASSIAHNLTMPVSGDSSDKASVFIRIRPETKKEKKYKAKGHEKYLADYNDNTVIMGGRKVGPSTKQYDFPKLVLGPDCDQQDAYKKLGLENLLDNFLFHQQDACILAYGQTGSGKTHTMFGDGLTREQILKAYSEGSRSEAEKSDNAIPEGWGIFPRTVVSALNKIKSLSRNTESSDSKYKVVSSTLSASVIEMYFGEIKDLLNEKSVLPITYTDKRNNKDFDFNATKQMKVESMEDLQKLIDVVFTERQSRGTKMNDSSSRSHCLTTLLLTKILVDDAGKKYVSQSMMQFVDLSGSERTSKTELSGTEITGTIPGWEGIMINLDLWALGFAVTDRTQIKSRKGKIGQQLSDSQKTKARMKQNAFPGFLCILLSRAINGETNCAVIMCVSPSKYNGDETNFTIEFGEKLSHLPSNPLPSKIKDYNQMLADVRKFLHENPGGDVPLEKMNKYKIAKEAIIASKKKELEFLESLT